MPEQAVSGENTAFSTAAGGFDGKYYIESVSLSGEKKTFEPIFPQYVNDLRPIAGATSEFLQSTKQIQAEYHKNRLVTRKIYA